MKKIVKNAIFIVILIVIAMSIFNISYAMLSTGNFSKMSTVKNTTVFTKDNDGFFHKKKVICFFESDSL